MNILKQPPAWVVALVGILWIIYQAIYPYLNPQHLQIQDAVVQVVLILLGLASGVKVGINHTNARLTTLEQGPPTLPMPIPERDIKREGPYSSDH